MSNSPAGLRRALDARDGRVPSQDDGLDRHFVRTQLPRDEAEDAFVYLSDDAIRRMVGPGLKLRESRRLECSASMRAISYASAWRRVRGAGPVESVDQLVEDGDLPSAMLFCPADGEYQLLAPGRAACSVHGTLAFLTPNAELELTTITKAEKGAYVRFRLAYQQYWRRYFDPIGMKLTLGPRKRVETVILPLIDTSQYRELAELFGGEGAQSGPLVECKEGTALLVSAHVNRQGRHFREAEPSLTEQIMGGGTVSALEWVGDRVSFWFDDPAEAIRLREEGDLQRMVFERVLKGEPAGIRVAVRNHLLLAPFLAAVKGALTGNLGMDLTWETVTSDDGVKLIRIRPDPRYVSEPQAVYYAVIGDGLCVSFNRASLEGVARRHAERQARDNGDQPANDDDPPAKHASFIDGTHIAIGIWLDHAPHWRALLQELFIAQGQHLCADSLEDLRHLQSLDIKDDPGRRALLGAMPCCPLGGRQLVNDDGSITCTHGLGADAPAATIRTPLHGLDSVRATLRFTAEGVHTVLEIDQAPPARAQP